MTCWTEQPHWFEVGEGCDEGLEVSRARGTTPGDVQAVGELEHPGPAQPGAGQQPGVTQEGARIALEHATGLDDGDLGGPGQREVDVVGREQDGGPPLLQAVQGREHLVDARGVEPGGRLVEEQEAGPHRDRPGDGDALALPEGQLVGRALGQLAQAEHLERLVDPGPDLILGEAEVERSEGDVTGHVGREELVVGVLEDELHLLTMGRQAGSAVPQGIRADTNLAGVRSQRTGEHPEERRLAGAVGPEERQPRPGSHVEGGSAQDRPSAVGDGDSAGCEAQVTHLRTLPSSAPPW